MVFSIPIIPGLQLEDYSLARFDGRVFFSGKLPLW
jgi:hypothetical protein